MSSYDRKTEPTVITKGERVTWTKSYCDYPASLYSLQYRFRFVGSGAGVGIDVNATADGDDFNVLIANTVSDDFTALGKHKWQSWITERADATNEVLVGEGYTTVNPGFVASTLSAVDERSTAKIMLDTLDAAILAAGSSDTIEWEVTTPAGSRRIKRDSRTNVLALRKYYAGIVSREDAAERSAAGKGFGTQVKVRFRGQ
jgi:hypothetical protein